MQTFPMIQTVHYLITGFINLYIMDKKIYDVLHKFMIYLSSAEDSWQNSPETTEVYYTQIRDLLSGIDMGKTDDEIIRRSLIAVATIVTRQNGSEDYPTINFVKQP